MTAEELLSHIYGSDIFKKWHWFNYHFKICRNGGSHPFAWSIVRACIECEQYLPGFSRSMVDAIASISGREKDRRQYEQLLQRLAELLIIRHVVRHPWPFAAKFRYEPTAGVSKMNPELVVEGGPFAFGIEVKAPSLLDHIDKRSQNPTQLPSRAPRDFRSAMPNASQGVTLPRDNPVKDFLSSSDAKFSAFKSVDPAFRSVLVIVWDDFIYEPISSLLHEQSGIFTPNSFAKDAHGVPLAFTNVDGVILVRHLHQFINASADRPLIDSCCDALEYGRDGEFPPKAFVANPNGKGLPEYVVQCMQAYTPSPEMGAEYIPSDVVWWVGT